MNDFDNLIPTWNEMEAILLSYPLQPTKWRQWLGTVGSGSLIYQIFTRDHMARLADYLQQQIAVWARTRTDATQPITIVEVKAQNDRFTTLLRHSLVNAGVSNDSVKIIAVTDLEETAVRRSFSVILPLVLTILRVLLTIDGIQWQCQSNGSRSSHHDPSTSYSHL
jgi:hypothetical protein